MLFTHFKRLEVIENISLDDIEQKAFDIRNDSDNEFKYGSYPKFLPSNFDVRITGVLHDDLNEDIRIHCLGQLNPDNSVFVNMLNSTSLEFENFLKAKVLGAYLLVYPSFHDFNPKYSGLLSMHNVNEMTEQQKQVNFIATKFAFELLAPKRDVSKFISDHKGMEKQEIISKMAYRYRLTGELIEKLWNKKFSS